jgi:hypothetical protein
MWKSRLYFGRAGWRYAGTGGTGSGAVDENANTNDPVGVEATTPPIGGGGFPEFSAFVHHGKEGNDANHQQFAVPLRIGEVGGGPVLALSLSMVRRLLPIFTDPTPIAADAHPSQLHLLRRTRGSLAVQLMLDQPFVSWDECERAGLALKQEFHDLPYAPDLTLSNTGAGTSSATLTRMGICQQAPMSSPLLGGGADSSFLSTQAKAERQTTAAATQGYWATGFLLGNRTTAINALAEQVLMLGTLKAYLRYMATVFVFEPQILARGGGYIMSKTAQDLAISGYRDPLVAKLRAEAVEALVPTAVPLPPYPYQQPLQSASAGAPYPHSRQPNADVFALAGLRANISQLDAAQWIGRRTCFSGREPVPPVSSSAEDGVGTAGWKVALERVGKCSEWDGVTAVDAAVWGTAAAVAVQGGDGTQFAPLLREAEGAAASDRRYAAVQPLVGTVSSTGDSSSNATMDDVGGTNVLQMWMGEAMRPMTLDFSMRLKRFGVALRRYKAVHLTRYEDKGVASSSGGSDHDAPINMLDLSRAHGGLPIFLGYPHFLHGVVSTIRDGVQGLKAEEGKHESLIDVEPMSGMAFNMRLRWQTTMQLERTSVWYRDFDQPHCVFGVGIGAQSSGGGRVDSICSLYLPVYWVGREGSVTREQAFEFKEGAYKSQETARKVAVGSFFVGSMAAAGSVVQAVQAMRLTFQAAQVAPIQMPNVDTQDLARLMPV